MPPDHDRRPESGHTVSPQTRESRRNRGGTDKTNVQSAERLICRSAEGCIVRLRADWGARGLAGPAREQRAGKAAASDLRPHITLRRGRSPRRDREERRARGTADGFASTERACRVGALCQVRILEVRLLICRLGFWPCRHGEAARLADPWNAARPCPPGGERRRRPRPAISQSALGGLELGRPYGRQSRNAQPASMMERDMQRRWGRGSLQGEAPKRGPP